MKVIDKSKGTRKNIDIVNVVKQSLSSIPSQKLEKSGKGGDETSGPQGDTAKKTGGGHSQVPKASKGAKSTLGTGGSVFGSGPPIGGH